MPKFSSQQQVKRQRPTLKSPIQTTQRGAPTFEGGAGFERDAKSNLFLLAVTNMVSENNFYEDAETRDARFSDLVHTVTQEDPEWVAAFIPYLRKEMFMRTATLVAAAEYVAAGGPHAAAVVASACQRPDEPGELLGYWHATYGRNEPKPIKRGLAAACQRLYTQDAAIKYDGLSLGIRLGDVIERVHPSPKDATQRALFAYLLDRRHHPQDIRVDMGNLPRIQNVLRLDALTDDKFHAEMANDPELLNNSGYTWERLLSARPELGKGRALWDAVIPNMGYMALLRNLRNFEEADISDRSKAFVMARLSDPAAVARSMQFPFRFLSAYKATHGLSYAPAIERALDLSVGNIPEVDGKTLVLVDVSASMNAALSKRSSVPRWEVGALFGVAQFLRSANADLVAYGSFSDRISLSSHSSVLRGVEEVQKIYTSARLGHGTETFPTIEKHFAGHDRLFIFTDEQSFPYENGGRWSTSYYRQPAEGIDRLLNQFKTVYNFNLAGYSQAHMDLTKGRYEFGGFSDATFRLIEMLERGKNAPWPWEV